MLNNNHPELGGGGRLEVAQAGVAAVMRGDLLLVQGRHLHTRRGEASHHN